MEQWINARFSFRVFNFPRAFIATQPGEVWVLSRGNNFKQNNEPTRSIKIIRWNLFTLVDLNECGAVGLMLPGSTQWRLPSTAIGHQFGRTEYLCSVVCVKPKAEKACKLIEPRSWNNGWLGCQRVLWFTRRWPLWFAWGEKLAPVDSLVNF